MSGLGLPVTLSARFHLKIILGAKKRRAYGTDSRLPPPSGHLEINDTGHSSRCKRVLGQNWELSNRKAGSLILRISMEPRE